MTGFKIINYARNYLDKNYTLVNKRFAWYDRRECDEDEDLDKEFWFSFNYDQNAIYQYDCEEFKKFIDKHRDSNYFKTTKLETSDFSIVLNVFGNNVKSAKAHEKIFKKSARHTKRWEEQGIFSTLQDFSQIVTAPFKAMKCVQELAKQATKVGTKNMSAFVIDVLALLAEMRDPFFFTPSKLLCWLGRFYSVVLRLSSLKDEMRSQSLGDDSFIPLLMTFGFPSVVLDKIKIFSLLSNKKISDAPNLIMRYISTFVDLVESSLVFVIEKFHIPGLEYVLQFLLKFTAGLKIYEYSSDLEEVIVEYRKCNLVLHDLNYRKKITELHNKLKTHEGFLIELAKPNFKFLKDEYNYFCNVIMKSCAAYTTATRTEPICIVFEGPPGCGKSTLASLLTEYLRAKNHTIYTHTVPPSDAGKDFYDDYNNQSVFLMDDVGQQAISQWRAIINWVSCIVYPLDCANADLKNTKTFNSEFIICTTNKFRNMTGLTKSDGIAEIDALYRRVHLINMKEVSYVNGIPSGDIKYEKFDYKSLEPEKWKNSFLFPDMEHVPVTMPASNPNKIVAWVDYIMAQALEDNRRNLNLSAVDDVRVAVIDNYKNEFRFQSFSNIPFYVASAFAQALTVAFASYLIEIVSSYFVDSTEETPMYTAIKISLKCLFGMLVCYAFTGTSAEALVGSAIGHSLSAVALTKMKQAMIMRYQSADNDFSRETPMTTKLTKVRSSMRILSIYPNKGKATICQSIMHGRIAIVPWHGCEVKTGTLNIAKSWSRMENSSFEQNNVPYEVVYENEEHDVTLIKIKTAIPMYSSILTSLEPSLRTVNFKDPNFINCEGIIPLIGNYRANPEDFVVKGVRKDRMFLKHSGINYPITASGLCGSLIVDSENGIVGMHSAGDEVEGYANIWSTSFKRSLYHYLEQSSISPEVTIRPDKNEEKYSGLRLENNTEFVKRPLRVSSLQKTPLFELLMEEVQVVGLRGPPNFLFDGLRSLKTRAKKSFKSVPKLDFEEKEFAKKCLRTMMTKFDDLTLQETVKGDGSNVGPMNKDSVNGLGYAKEKSVYMNIQEGTISPEFQKKLDDFILRCNQDSVTKEDLMFYEAFKDEARNEEKMNKPRTFRVAPLHHTFLLKMTLGKLLGHIKKNMWNNGICIGFNPFKDFNKLFNILNSYDFHGDGDFGDYDGSCAPEIQDLTNEVVLEFYDGKFRAVLELLLNSCVRGLVLVGEELHYCTHSMPSGAYITALFNSFYNRVITFMTYYRECKKVNRLPKVNEALSILDFVLGDDKLFATKGELGKIVNCLTIKSFAESLGMTFTDAVKGEIDYESKPLLSTQFLKREFVFHKELGKYVGSLAPQTLCNMLCYTDSNKDYIDVMSGRATVFEIEKYLHRYSPYHTLIEGAWTKIVSVSDSGDFPIIELGDSRIKQIMADDDSYAFYYKKAYEF